MAGKVKTHANDVLLDSLAANAQPVDQHHVVGEWPSDGRRRAMCPKDPNFKAVVAHTLSGLARSGKLAQLYNKWFQ
jgi:hypothetical protein